MHRGVFSVDPLPIRPAVLCSLFSEAEASFVSRYGDTSWPPTSRAAFLVSGVMVG